MNGESLVSKHLEHTGAIKDGMKNVLCSKIRVRALDFVLDGLRERKGISSHDNRR